MKLFSIPLFSALLVALLFGCSTPTSIQETSPPEPDVDPIVEQVVEPEPVAEPEVVMETFPEIGRLTLIRTEPEPSADEVLVYTNEVLLAVIGNQSYVEIDFPAGMVMLTLDWQDTPMKFTEEIELDTSFATNKFLTISHRFDVPEISKKEASTDYTMEETLLLFELPEAFGANLIKKLEPEFSYVFEPVD